MFSKAVNGIYYVVEAVPDTSKHMTYITSAYMTKNKPTGVQSADAFAPTLTAKPEADLPVGTQNVPKAAPNVNTEGLETRLLQTAETVRDAAVTPDAVKQSINENIENGGYQYIPESNADAVASVRAGINRTAEFALIISAELLAGKTYLRRGGRRDVYQRIINTFL